MKVLRYFSISLLVLVVLLFSAVFLVPVDRYISEAERVVGGLLGRPVTIRQMKLDMFPAPHLHIEGVSVGEHAGASVGVLEARFDVWALLRSECELTRVEVSHVELSEEILREFFGRILSSGGGEVEPALCRIRRLEVEDVRLNMPDMPLGGIKGGVSFVGEAVPALITLYVPEFDLTATMRPTASGVFQVEANSPAWAPKGMPQFGVEQLRMRGEISASGLEVKEFSGRLQQMGFRGAASLSWAGLPEYVLRGELDWSGARSVPSCGFGGGGRLPWGSWVGVRCSAHAEVLRSS
jgi:hypothetical protein